jgi:hypothetical protein
MKQTNHFLKIFSITIGSAIVFLTFFNNLFFESWFTVMMVFIFLGLVFLAVTVVGLFRAASFYLKLLLLVAGGIVAGNFYDPEWFKSPKILVAELQDDLSRLTLVLRQNNDFELSSQDLFSTQVYSGKYVRNNEKIIFLSRPYDNDFIPDTVNIINDKIILRTVNGVPDTSFASYFQIQRLP